MSSFQCLLSHYVSVMKSLYNLLPTCRLIIENLVEIKVSSEVARRSAYIYASVRNKKNEKGVRWTTMYVTITGCPPFFLGVGQLRTS